MKEYDLYLPLFSNRGKRIPRKVVDGLKRELITRFGGLTYFPQAHKGFWRVGKVTFRDELVILKVLCEDSEAIRRYWRELKEKLKIRLKQKDILILRKNITVL